ncbi:MAG: carboxylate-amine ligase [Chloroflexi bacterium]|nr:MAG: carboxylate-amine ligase [Chloroflexota bacterium]
MAVQDAWTIGVEEEYQVIDATTRQLQPDAERLLHGAQAALGDDVQPELMQSQIEAATAVCATLADVRAALTQARRTLIDTAAKHGDRLGAAGTHPFSNWRAQQTTPKARYQGLSHHFQRLARELVIFGCHVHVSIPDRAAALAVMNRARIWLTPLLALAANSPFWQGEDTGYASFRTELWSRFPMAGPPVLFESLAEYDQLVETLVTTESIKDATNIYWDIRLPARFPTIEFRVTDVCLTVDEAVMIAGLTRGLVRTCYEQWVAHVPVVAARPELLRAAHWRAARYGLEATLIDVLAGSSVPARQLVEQLLTFVRPALEEEGDWDEVAALVRMTLQRGTGAQRQRWAYQRAGRWEDVVDLIVSETAQGVVDS